LNQKYVFVVGKNNTLEYRTVKLGPMTDGLRVVRDGLHEGDVIVVSGLQRVRPGVAVTPKKVSMASPTSPLSNTSAQSALVGAEEKPRESKARE
jgi:multidrug efflux system membrane fusion protein